MRIDRIRYGITVDSYQYEDQRLEIEACVEDGESWEDVLSQLQIKVHSFSQVQERLKEQEEIIQENKSTYFRIRGTLWEMRRQWEAAKSICDAHGIKLPKDHLPAILTCENEEELFGIPYEIEGIY